MNANYLAKGTNQWGTSDSFEIGQRWDFKNAINNWQEWKRILSICEKGACEREESEGVWEGEWRREREGGEYGRERKITHKSKLMLLCQKGGRVTGDGHRAPEVMNPGLEMILLFFCLLELQTKGCYWMTQSSLEELVPEIGSSSLPNVKYLYLSWGVWVLSLSFFPNFEAGN